MKVTINIPDNIYRSMNLTPDKVTRIVLKTVPSEKRLALLGIKQKIKEVLSDGKKRSVEDILLAMPDVKYEFIKDETGIYQTYFSIKQN